MFGHDSAEFAEVRAVAAHDVTLLANELLGLDALANAPGAAPAAVADYRTATAHFTTAQQSLDVARSVADLRHVSAAVDEGRYAIACAKARLAGETPPPRRPPCFFDPAHGVSLSDVDWTLPDGSTRRVPACGACAVAILQGSTPTSRELETPAGRVPHWAAPGHYAPYARGFYHGRGGFGGALVGGLAGLAAGTMLGDILGSLDDGDSAGWD